MFNDVFDGININYRVGQVLQAASRLRVKLGSFIVWTVFKPTKKQSMKVQSVHVMNAFIIQNGRSSYKA